MTFDLSAIGRGLPVAQQISQLPELIEKTGTLIVEAPPGTGKTTLVPPALHNHTGGKVLVTAPRRVAVRAAAHRLALLDGTDVGQRVGYAVRGESRPGSAVEFCTPGVLLRRLLADPELRGISGVIIDEVHERQIDSDLCLAFLAEITQLREDLRVIAMSATLDTSRYAELLHGAKVLSTPAVTYPLEISYHPHPERFHRSPEFFAHLASLASAAVDKHGHSALVFVPGVREIDAVLSHLGPCGMALHGRLSLKEQNQALTPTSSPRIVVATSVAESSLTVPGVRIVVDSGLSRVPRRDAARQMNGLVTISEPRSTADQRAGRAGREGPGIVLRAFSESDYQHFDPHITPEILCTDLTDTALTLAAWGTPRGEGLNMLDQPPAGALDEAERTLSELGAIDEEHRITAHGEKLRTLPLEPRLASALLQLGKAAAATVATLADSPRGDVAKQPSDRALTRRLASLVDDRGPCKPGAVVAAAYPRQIARRDGEDYLLASGTRAHLPASMGLAGNQWLAIAEVSVTGKKATIRAAAAISEREALAAIGTRKEVIAWLEEGRIRGREITYAGAIELSSTPVTVPPKKAVEALSKTLRLEDMSFSDAATQLYWRLSFLHEQLGEPWPDPQTVDLTPEIQQIASGTPVARVDMYPAMQRMLPWPEAAQLEKLAPQRLKVPSGSKIRLDYSTGRPVARVKLQECFGLSRSPECAGVKVQFHLLSPAGRPLAVTDDLASFWEGPYVDVRKDMRGRYPKHPWPEDPNSAVATARTKQK